MWQRQQPPANRCNNRSLLHWTAAKMMLNWLGTIQTRWMQQFQPPITQEGEKRKREKNLIKSPFTVWSHHEHTFTFAFQNFLNYSPWSFNSRLPKWIYMYFLTWSDLHFALQFTFVIESNSNAKWHLLS